MTRSVMMMAVLGLVLQTAAAFATPFEPVGAPRGGQDRDVEEISNRFNVGLSIASWARDDIEETAYALGVKYKSKVRPLVTADYQVTPQIAVGGWYNPVAWDAEFRWDQAPGPGGGAPPGLVTKFEGTGSMYEVHGTYAFGGGWAAQLAYQDMNLDWKLAGASAGADKASKLVLWGTKSFAFGPEETQPWGVVLGLGVAKGLSGTYDSRVDRTTGDSLEAKETTWNALAGVSYAFSPRFSANASVWLADFSRDEEKSTRIQAGVTGRF